MAKEYIGLATNDYFQGNGKAELMIIEGLTFTSTVGVQITNYKSGYYYPTSLNAGKSAPGGEANISGSKNTEITTSDYFTYNKEFNRIHRFSAMAGYEWQKRRSENYAFTNRTFPTDQFQFWNMGAGTDRISNSSGLSEWVIASFYGRLNYNFNDRYLVTVSGRYDGSSRLGANAKWGFFPSGALAWNIHNEQFMESLDFISQMKLRVGYGATGNTSIGTYTSLANLESQLVSINERQVNAIRPSTNNVPNEDLRWESTNQTNIGLDMGFFKGRLGITAEWYLKKSTGLLYNFPLPAYSGYSSAQSNIGSIENKGFELEIRTVNFNGKDFGWDTDFNISFPTSKVAHLPLGEILTNRKPGHITDFTETHILREGLPVGSFYGYIFDGINPDNGTVMFKDIASRDADGNLIPVPDGVISPNDDRTVIGNPNPDCVLGFTNTFRYKDFDLNIFFQGVVGNDMYSFMRMELEWCNGKTNQMSSVKNRWTETNRNTDIPVASPTHSATSSSRWIEKGSYLRLQNVSLGYNLNVPVLKNMGVERCRIYVSGQNLLLFTNFSGYDPDVSFRNDNTTLGLDYGSYPHSRSVTFGLNLMF
jgi:TonB-linked SusC/RagA family outer membrane protein